MERLPQRTSLVTQTAEVLREAIASGQWRQWLPGELELIRRLRISRVTLRSALAELEREKLIRAGQGRRREIIDREEASSPRAASNAVVLLSPAPLHQLPALTVFWIDELREHLEAAGRSLEVRESIAAYRRRPAHALEELSTRLQPAGWLLYRSTSEMQRWFGSHARSVVVAGSLHPGIAVSSVDVDHSASCRHAAGRFLANGHRRVAIVRPDTKLAGDLESVAGFEAGMGAEVPAILHNGSLNGICSALDRLFARAQPPTGLFVFHAPHFLTVLGWLQRRQLRVPDDVSVICRDSEPFLESVIPSPTRYVINATQYARKISRLVTSLVTDGQTQPHHLRIMPSFFRGETLGPAKSISAF